MYDEFGNSKLVRGVTHCGFGGGGQQPAAQATQSPFNIGQLAAVNAMNSQPVNQTPADQAMSGAPMQGVPASTPTPTHPASSSFNSPASLAQMYQRMQQGQQPQGGGGILGGVMNLPFGTNAAGGVQSLGQILGPAALSLFA